ncbi:MAG: hypothetical protein ABII00_18635 [Elusimicrobiota bacterium]
MTPRQFTLSALAWSFVFLISGCGGGDGTPTSPSPPPTNGPAITIGPSGVSPTELTIAVGERVTFVNNDSRSHEVTSNPHPVHTDCPEVNQVGFLQPGQSRQTASFGSPRTCGFHDHSQPENGALMGRIIVR